MKLFFNGLYLLKLCPNFVGSVQNLGDRYQKSIWLELISDQRCTLGWMPNQKSKSYRNSSTYVSPKQQILFEIDFNFQNRIINHKLVNKKLDSTMMPYCRHTYVIPYLQILFKMDFNSQNRICRNTKIQEGSLVWAHFSSL